MSMCDPYPSEWFVHHFEVGDFVECKRTPGAIFEIVENCRDYDAIALVKIKFVGPRRGIPPRTKGRLHKHFRIKALTVDDKHLIPANPMLTLAAAAGG